jgi:archaeal flagellar protein FlaJ
MDAGVGNGPEAAGSALEKAVIWRSRTYASLLGMAGGAGNPVAIAGESVTKARRTAMIAIPLSVAGAVVFTPLALLGCALPLLAFLLPEVKLRDRVAQRREGVEKELPFFSVLVGVLGGAGVPLYTILKGLEKSDVFPAMRNESMLVVRDVEIFGMNPIEALERLVAHHPSKRFGEFLLGYTSKARSGGDVASYLTAESGSLLMELEQSWAGYVARVGVVGSLMITIFGVVPLLLMVAGVFSPAFSAVGLLYFAVIGVPLFTLALLFMAGRMQPAHDAPVSGSLVKASLASLAAVAVWAATRSPWETAATGFILFFLMYGFNVRERLAETRAVDKGVTRFLRDLLEYKRQDYDLSRAVMATEAHGGYTPQFARILAGVASKLRAGVPLDEVKVECDSRLGRLTFLLLGHMSRSGGGTVDTVYQVSNFADRTMQLRKNAVAEMRPYLVLSYLSPVLLAFGVTFVGGVLASLGGNLRPGLLALHLSSAAPTTPPDPLSQTSNLLIVVAAASMGLIGAKMTDLTVKNTLRAAAAVALAGGAVALMSFVGIHSLTGLFTK